MAAKKRGKKRAMASESAKPPPQPKQSVRVPEPCDESSPTPADEDASASERGRPELPVAGLVASAGGLDAFKKFFAAMPADSGIAFVLIPHLDPTHESLMVELLARHTSMPVVEAAEGMAVEANRVYIIPPNKYMTISGGVLRLTGPVERGGWQTSIDLFLRSLADDQQEKAICIILSGTGSHGTLGLKAVKAAGGMAMVQDPKTADYPRMPESAIATGLADYVLPVEQMPEALVKYVQHCYVNGGRVVAAVAEAPDHLNQLLALLRARTKFDFRCYRKKMLARRLERRMGLSHFENVADYLAHLREHPEEVKQLARDLLDQRDQLLPRPGRLPHSGDGSHRPAHPGEGRRRPACASGSPAAPPARRLTPSPCCCSNSQTAAQNRCRLQIFATDVDEQALEVARRGIYPESISADVSPERLARFFTRVDESAWQVSKQLRETVTFARSKPDHRRPLFQAGPDQLPQPADLPRTGGAEEDHRPLALRSQRGRLPVPGPVGDGWPANRPVRAGLQEMAHLPAHRPESGGRLAVPGDAGGATPGQAAAGQPAPGSSQVGGAGAELPAAPVCAWPAVLINRKYEVLHFAGPTEDYLVQPGGPPTQDLLSLAREGLESKLRVVIRRAIRENAPQSIKGVMMRHGGDIRRVNIEAEPLDASKQTEGLLLISFQEQPNPSGETLAEARTRAETAESDLLRQLEQELETTRDDLQSTIEELESSNEELKASNEEVMSMNEELQSANEELETSKEELQSLNEELSTVNNQLHDKVEEVESANNDMANLLNCTDIATVFLDAGLRIKLFTPAATRLFNLIATDRRPADQRHRHEVHRRRLAARGPAGPARPDAARKGSAHRGRPLVHSADHALPHPGQPHRRRRDHLRGHHRAQAGRGRGRPAPAPPWSRVPRTRSSARISTGPSRPGTGAPSGFTGYSRDEAVGRSVKMLVPEDRADEWTRVMAIAGARRACRAARDGACPQGRTACRGRR